MVRMPDVTTWPEGVRKISLDELDNFGLDAEGRLYFDGRPVEIRRGVSLTFWQRVGAVVTVTSAAVVAVASVVDLVLRCV